MAFEALFKPIKIGSMLLQNRIIMSAMSTRFPKRGGGLTNLVFEHYTRRARGGASLITIELADVHPLMPHLNQTLWLHNDNTIEEMRQLTDAVHKNGSKASIQVGIFFRPWESGICQYTSSLKSPEAKPGAKELTISEIHMLSDIISEGCLRAKKAGFDAVELHGMHGSIVEEFLSPYWNKRDDEYGGDRERRMRFPLEVLEKSRDKVGKDFPLIYRICGSEFTPGGTDVDDAIAFVQAATEKGINAISLSGGLAHIDHLAMTSSYEKRGILLPSAKKIKENSSVPIIVANGLTPQMAYDAVEQGITDIVALGRPLLTDPDWPLKMKRGAIKEIRPCIRCNQGCMGGLRDNTLPHIMCLSNPQVGREFQGQPAPAAVAKKLLVIGGGISGCEFSYVAAQRGHHVILVEKNDKLGGQFRIAAVPPGKEDFKALIEYFEVVLPRSGVDIQYNTVASKELIQLINPDHIVVATGSEPVKPRINGMELSKVCLAADVLLNKVQPTGSIVVLGGGATGLETGHLLAEQGNKVTIVDMMQIFGKDIVSGVGVREKLLSIMEKLGVQFMPGKRVHAITQEGVLLDDRPLFGGGNIDLLKCDYVVVAMGQRPVAKLAEELKQCPIPVTVLGDCKKIGNALSAMHNAYELALSL